MSSRAYSIFYKIGIGFGIVTVLPLAVLYFSVLVAVVVLDLVAAGLHLTGHLMREHATRPVLDKFISLARWATERRKAR
jgi:hypothetical protein